MFFNTSLSLCYTDVKKKLGSANHWRRVNIIPNEIQKQVDRAAEILQQGGVVAFPTETVYGLAASIKIPEAVERIYRIKGRSAAKALPLVLSRLSQVDEVAVSLSPVARRLMEHFWPGNLTLVVRKSKVVLDVVTSGGDTVAIRISSHPVAVALVEALGTPITGTSANISGRKSPATAAEVRLQLGNKVDLIVKSGQRLGGIESTIIDVTCDVPVILREGAISREAIKRICEIK